MGEGVTFTCPRCLYSMELSVGCGFLGDPRSPRTREAVLAGRFGKTAKRALEEHPDADCGRYTPLFHCSCGNYSSKDAVFVADRDGYHYRPSRRCSLCHGKMWEVAVCGTREVQPQKAGIYL